MKDVRSITGKPYLYALAVLVAGCADQQPTTPRGPKLKVAEARAPITVSSQITLTDNAGVTRTFTKVQQLRPVLNGGVAFSMVVTDSSAVATGYTEPLTPIVAVSTGTAVGNYSEYVTDTTTAKVYRIVATGPRIYNYPIDVAYGYDSRGYKVAETHYKWTPVTGGYALLQQKEVSYSSAGAVTATVVSTVTNPATYAMAETPSIPARLATLVQRISCYFAPKVAYAQGKSKGGAGGVVNPYTMPLPGTSPCWWEAGVLAINTGTLGVESAFGVLEPVMIPAYLLTWTSWTHSLWDFLHCLNRQPRCSGSGCNGGGGSGF